MLLSTICYNDKNMKKNNLNRNLLLQHSIIYSIYYMYSLYIVYIYLLFFFFLLLLLLLDYYD